MKTIEERRKEILKLRKNGESYGKIASKLNESKSYVAFVCKQSDEDLKKTIEREKSKEEYELMICSIISECFNINQVCKRLFLRNTTTNYKRIKKIIEKYNVDTTHFSNIEESNKTNKKLEKEEIFVENSQIQTSKIRNYLFKFNKKEKKCECCGNTEWMGKQIPLQVHHINGDNTDNRIENLQILCPNCHAQTDTYCGKNKKHKHTGDKDCGFCKMCGKPLTNGQKVYCSIDCRSLDRIKNNFTEEELVNSFRTLGSFESVGRHFGITGKSIVKWLKKFGLPTKKKELKEYINKFGEKDTL